MKTVVTCPGCGKRYQVAPERLGSRGRCKQCGSVIDTTALVAGAGAPPAASPAQEVVSAGAPARLPQQMLANRVIAGRTCELCNNPIELGQEVRNCEHCQHSLHLSCWQDRGGCVTKGCANAPLPKLVPTRVAVAPTPPVSPAPPVTSPSPVSQATAAPSAPPEQPAATAPPPSGQANDRKPCPFCGESIARAAKKCRFCNEFLTDGALRAATHKVKTRVERSQLALASLICGIASVVICFIGFILGPVGIGLGIKAKKEIEESRGQQTGRELALAGIITGSLGTFIWLVLIIVGALGE